MYSYLTHCRGCRNNLTLHPTVFRLGPQWIATYFVGQKGIASTLRWPLELKECQECGLVQLDGTVDREVLFSNYWYRSSISTTMREHLKSLAEEASTVACLKPGDVVVDIGANDGTLLGYFSDGVRKVAFEPSQIADEITGDVEVHKTFFPPYPHTTKTIAQKAKLITAIAMFYDLEDPGKFLDDCRQVLHEDGVLCIEVADWPHLMKMGAFDTICHEHLLYFSLRTLTGLAKRSGLRPAVIRQTTINGASLRVYFRHSTSDLCISTEELEKWLSVEMFMTPTWEHFTEDAENNCNELFAHLVREQVDGRQGVGLGASTKGNVFLQAAGLHRGLIEWIEDRDPTKEGLKTLGTGIPIVKEKPWDIRHHSIHWKLILPWHFLPEIVEREMLFLKEGGTLLAAIPQFRAITKDNWEEEIRRFRADTTFFVPRLGGEETSVSSSTTGS